MIPMYPTYPLNPIYPTYPNIRQPYHIYQPLNLLREEMQTSIYNYINSSIEGIVNIMILAKLLAGDYEGQTDNDTN